MQSMVPFVWMLSFILLHHRNRRNTILEIILIDEDGKTYYIFNKIETTKNNGIFCFFFVFSTISHNLWHINLKQSCILSEFLLEDCVFGIIFKYAHIHTHTHLCRTSCVYMYTCINSVKIGVIPFYLITPRFNVVQCWWYCALSGYVVFVSSRTPMMIFAVLCQT